MLNWPAYTFVRITAAFISGILLYTYFSQVYSFMLAGLAVLFLLFLVLWFITRLQKNSFLTFLCGLAGLGCFAAAGYLLTYNHTQSNHPDNLVHHQQKISGYVAVVDDYLQEKEGYFTTTIRVSKVYSDGSWHQRNGLVLINFKKDSTGFRLRYGDVLLVHGAPRPTQPPANPEQFDYRKYLARKNIFFQHFLSAGKVVRLQEATPNLLVGYSVLLRRKLDSVFKQHLTHKREYGIASALILGVKDDLDNNLKNAYSNTGTMHVLAVSGLHVGLIFTVAMLLLKRFRSTARQRILSAVVLLLIIWSYAFITALSASVLRAVVMFTFVTIGTTFRRQKNIYNTLAAAAFFLLWYNPYFLFEVGFQLSFLAVVSIVYLQPKLYNLLTFENRALDWAWALTCVSVAAQIGTFPLGLLYFHQFPAYFLVSNLVAVPMATLILYSGFVMLMLSWVPVLNQVLGQVLEALIWLLNWFIRFMEQLPLSTLDGIYISQVQLFLLYGGILWLLIFLAFKRLPYMALATTCFVLVSGIHLQRVSAQAKASTFVVYNIRNQSIYGFLHGRQGGIIADSAFYRKEGNFNFNLKPHMVRAGIRQVKMGVLQKPEYSQVVPAETPEGNLLYMWRGLKIMVLQQPPACCPPAPVAVDYIILKNNPGFTPEQLKQSFTCKKVVFDSSNVPWYQNRMKEEFDRIGIPYHVVSEEGAFQAPGF